MLLFVCFLSLFLFVQNGWSALHFALHFDIEDDLNEIVKILVENGANVDLQNHVFSFSFFFFSLSLSLLCCCLFVF